MELRKNMLFTVTVENCSGNGTGIAHIDGLVVFVQGALRGEQCEIRLLKVKRTVAFAKVERILSSSPHRRKPECPSFPVCGGCSFWHMTYEEELEIKRQQLEETLFRIGGISIPVPPVLGAETIFQYRNKAQFPVAATSKGLQIGFYRARSHDVVSIENCLIQSDAANQAAHALRKWMQRFHIESYSETTHHGLVRHLYIRTNQTGESLVCIIINGTTLPQKESFVRILREICPSVVGVLFCVNQRKDNVILGEEYHLLWGQDYLIDELMGLQFRLSVPSFFQVNHAQTVRLYQIAISYAALDGSETVLDLYCGVGTISLSIAAKVKHVIGVELVPEAVQDAKENAMRNHITNADFFCADAGTAASRLIQEGIQPDVIIVDPPRKGLDQMVIDAMLHLSPTRIVYVSCDPATLSRDLKKLTQNGYTLKTVTAVDMFPRTKHVETVVLLSRDI